MSGPVGLWRSVDALLPHLDAALGDALTVAFSGLRVVAVYAGVLVLLRLAGKRVLGQFTPFDLLTLLLIANAVQNAMIGPDDSLTGGLVAAGVLVLANRWVSRWPRLRARIEGHPEILVQDGAVRTEALDRESVSADELAAALREHGLDDVGDVASAVLEVDGTISVVPVRGEGVRRLHRVRSSRNR